jgi:hypothetical protein
MGSKMMTTDSLSIMSYTQKPDPQQKVRLAPYHFHSTDTSLDTDDPFVVLETVLSKIEAGTATDEDLAIYLRVKQSLGHS